MTMEIELLEELQNKQFDEKDLRREIEHYLLQADKIKSKYKNESTIKLEEIELLEQKLLSFLPEEIKLKARIAAIVDLYPSYSELLDDITNFENALHKEVYTRKKRLKKIESERINIPKKITDIKLSVSELKKPINTQLEPIEDKVCKLRLELDKNLIHQEKLKKVLDPVYNRKSTIEKKLEDQDSDLYLILSIIFLAALSPYLAFVPVLPMLYLLHKLQKNRKARVRAKSHKERV